VVSVDVGNRKADDMGMTLLTDLRKLAADCDYDKLMGRMLIEYPQIRRAIAIAQAVEELDASVYFDSKPEIMRRADELLEGK
jgi:hypothetical protein